MNLQSVSHLIQTVRTIYSLTNFLKCRIWDFLLTQFYQLFPNQEGELDVKLKSDIRKNLLYASVRFRAFNNSVGHLISNSLLLLLVMIPFAIAAVLLSPYLNGLLEVVLLVLLGSAGILMGASMVLLGVADLLLILYTASLVRFALKKIQPDFKPTDEKAPTTFTSMFSDSSGFHEIRVYKSNLEATFRLIAYLLLCLSVAVVNFSARHISQFAINMVNTSTIQWIFDLPYIPGVNNLLASLDALLPIDLMVLITPESFPFLKSLTFGLLLFSAFLNWKTVYQSALRSQFEWSEYDTFSSKNEFHRCWETAKITMYHFLQGDLREEFTMIRGQIAYFPLVIILSISLTYFYLALLSGSI